MGHIPFIEQLNPGVVVIRKERPRRKQCDPCLYCLCMASVANALTSATVSRSIYHLAGDVICLPFSAKTWINDSSFGTLCYSISYWFWVMYKTRDKCGVYFDQLINLRDRDSNRTNTHSRIFTLAKHLRCRNGLEGLTYCELARVATKRSAEWGAEMPGENSNTIPPNGSDRGPQSRLTRSWSIIHSLDLLVLFPARPVRRASREKNRMVSKAHHRLSPAHHGFHR